MIRQSSIVLLMLVFGCAGPTKAGKEARVRAHERMDIVNADLAAQQASQQFEVGQLDTALETIDAAIARYQSNGQYYLLRGRILFEQHRLDPAIQSFEKVCELVPDLAEPHYFLGVIYQRCSDDVAALDEYKQAMKLDNTHPQYVLASAETLVALGKLDEAIDLVKEASNSFQHQPAMHALLGHIYLRKGDYETATHHLSDSILLGNDDRETLETLSNAYYQAGNYGDCLDTLKQLESESGDLSSYNTRVRAKCLVSTGRIVEGRDLCLEVTRKTPENVGCWVDLGYIAWEMGDYRRLDDCGVRIEQLNEMLPEAALFQGVAAMNLGNGEKAAAMLSNVKSDNTNNALTTLITSMQAKSVKTGLETPIEQNTPLQTAEGEPERPSDETSGTGEIITVLQETPHAP